MLVGQLSPTPNPCVEAPPRSQTLPQNRGSASQGPRLARAMLHFQGRVPGIREPEGGAN